MKLVVFLNNKWLLISMPLLLAVLMTCMQSYSVSAAGSYDNLLRNGSFESGSTSWGSTDGYAPFISNSFSSDGGYSTGMYPASYKPVDDVYQYVYIPNDSDATPFLFFDFVYNSGYPAVNYDYARVRISNVYDPNDYEWTNYYGAADDTRFDFYSDGADLSRWKGKHVYVNFAAVGYVNGQFTGNSFYVDNASVINIPHNLNIGVTNGGNISLSTGEACTKAKCTYLKGSGAVTLTANVASDVEFVSWEGCDNPIGNICNLNISDVTNMKYPVAKYEYSLASNVTFESGPWWSAQSTKFVASGEFNGDTYDDKAIVYDYGKSVMGILIQSGASPTSTIMSWQSGPWWSVENTKFVTTGDYNADGRTDISMVYDYGGSVMGIWVFENDGVGGFTPKLSWKSGPWWGTTNTKFVTSGDYNADGKDDIGMVYDYGGSVMGIWVFENDGTGFTPKFYWKSGPWWGVPNTKFVTSGDYNADGKDDIGMVYDLGLNRIRIFDFKASGRVYTR